MKIIKKLRFSRMFIPIVILALFLGTVSVGAGVATVLNLTSTSEETVEPIVYTLDNQEMIDKIATHAYTVKSFANGYLKMSTVQADGYGAPGRFTLQPSWSTLGDAFEVQSRSYFKVNYILSGMPTDETSFEVNLTINHDNDGTAVSSYSWITIDKTKHGFDNGDELEIIVDMAKKGTSTNGQYALVSDAVWVRNVTDGGEYVQVNSYASATEYKGEIVSADIQLATTGSACLTRTAYVKYFGFFATEDEALEYPLAAEIAKLQENNTKTIDGSHKTKGHAIEAAEAYIASFGFTTNPEVKVGDFKAPTETTEGSYVFDVVFKNQTTVTVTMTIEKAIEPIVYTLDNQAMIDKIATHAYTVKNFENGYLKMSTVQADGYGAAGRFTLQPSWSTLGNAFEVQSRRYFKVNYILSGMPTDETSFEVNLTINHDNDGTSVSSYSWITIDKTKHGFDNGDELEIIVDMAKKGTSTNGQYALVSDAVWVRNVTDGGEYVQVNSYASATEYKGEIVSADIQLATTGSACLTRVAYVKYFGFFNNLDAAKLYPTKEPVSPLVEAYILEDAKTITCDGSVNTKALAMAEAQSYIDSFGFTTNPVVQEGTFIAPTTQAEGSYVFDVVFGTTDSKTVTVTMTIQKVIEPIVYTLDNADILSKLDSHYYTVLSLENGYVKMQTRTGDVGYTNASGLALTPNWPKLGDAFDVEDKTFLKFDYKLSGLPDGQDQFGVNLYVYHGDASIQSAVEFNVSRTTHSFENGDELEIIVDMSKRNTTDDAVWIKNVTKDTEYIAAPLTYHNDTNYEGEIVKADFRLGVINDVERTAYVQYFGFFDTLTAAKNYNGATVAQQRLETMEQELQGLLDTLSIEWGDGNTEEKALSRATALIGEAGIGAELAITGYTEPTEDQDGSVNFSTTLVSGGQTANVDGLAIKINKVPESIVWRFNTQELKDKLGLANDTIASIENHHLKLERTSATGTNNLGFTVETPADAEQFYLQSYPYIVMKYKRHGVGPFQITYSTDKYTDTTITNTLLGLGPIEDQWYTSIVDTTVKDREAPIVWNFNHDDASKNWNYRLPTPVALLPTDRWQGLTYDFDFFFNTFRQEDATVEIEYIAFFPTMKAALEYKNANEIESLKLNAEVALKDYAGASVFYKDGDNVDTARATAKELIESKLGTELMKKVEVTITDGSYVEPNADSEGSYTFTASVTTQDGQTELYVKSNLTLTFLDPNDVPAALDAITDISDATCYHSDALTEEGAEHTAKKLLASQVAEGVEIVEVNCVSLTPSTQDTTGNFTCEVTLGYGDVTATYTKTVSVVATVNQMPNEAIIIDADDLSKLSSGTLNIENEGGNIHTESYYDPARSDEYFWIGDQVTPWFYLPDYPYFSMKLNRTVDSGDSMGRSQIYFWNTESEGAPYLDMELGGIDMNGKWVSTVINMRDGSATLYDMETMSVHSTKAAVGNLVGSGYDGHLTRLRITTSRDITAKRVTDIEYIGFFPTAEMVEDYMKGILVDGFHSFNGAEHAVAEDALDVAPRTLEAVVRIESEKLGSAMTIISNKESAEDTDYFALETTEDGNVKLVYGGQEIMTTDENVYTGEWVYIAAVVGDTEATIYIIDSKGQVENETTGTISATASAGLLVAPVVGGDYTTDNNFVGDIANVELYATAKADITFPDYKLPADPKAEDVIACWPMSRLTAENTYEDIHGTNTLTLKDAKGIAGHEFTGSDYVKTEKDLTAELKTFESLIKISESQLTGTYTLISNETNDSEDHFSIQLVDGEIQVEYNSGDNKVLTTSGLDLTPGKWIPVKVTFGDTPALYIDGTPVYVTTQAVNAGVSLAKVYIGASLEDTKETFVGHMSDVKLWGTDDNLLSAWMLDKQTYLKYEDASGNENTATLYSNGWYKLENLTYDYTIMHVADTQNLIGYDRENQYLEMMGWIAKNKEKLNTQFLFHLGDVTQVNTMNEWAMAKEGFDLLDAVKLPYTIALGNHDYSTPSHGIGSEFRDETNFNAKFPFDEYLTNDEDVTGKGAFEEGNSINVYKCFDVETGNGTIEYIVFALEFGPRDEVLDWVSDVLKANPNKKAIITTHSYQHESGRLATFDAQTYGGDFKDANEGIDVWNKLVSKHDNIVMVNCGHAQGKSTKHLMKNNDAGKGVVQILADPSALLDDNFRNDSSCGVFMIMAFTEDGTMHTHYYSPIKNMYWDTANEYTYNMFTDNGAVCVQEKGQ